MGCGCGSGTLHTVDAIGRGIKPLNGDEMDRVTRVGVVLKREAPQMECEPKIMPWTWSEEGSGR